MNKAILLPVIEVQSACIGSKPKVSIRIIQSAKDGIITQVGSIIPGQVLPHQLPIQIIFTNAIPICPDPQDPIPVLANPPNLVKFNRSGFILSLAYQLKFGLNSWHQVDPVSIGSKPEVFFPVFKNGLNGSVG